MKDILAQCRRIVGHFKHSQLAFSKFKEIQTSLGIPHHRLKQDVATRWNSTLYMLESIVSQKMALAIYTTENDGIPQLLSHQLDIIEKVISVLKLVEDITQSISSSTASITLIIPFVRALKMSWENTTDDQGVQTMKKEMLHLLNARFSDVEDKESLVLVILLDPCFKDKFFSNLAKQDEAKQLLITRVDEISDLTPSPRTTNCEPPEKRARTEVMKCFDQILEEASTVQSSSTGISIIDQYLVEPIVPYYGGNAYKWWADNHLRFKPLNELAKRYLSPPPTSVPSERLFSNASDIYYEKRNQLAPEKAESLLFIKNNYGPL